MVQIKTTRRIAKNSIFLFCGEVIRIISVLILTVFIARHLGAVGFGKFSFALSFAVIFVIFADIGLTQLVVRDVARNKSEAGKYISNVTLIKLILSFFTWGLIFLMINLMKYPKETTHAVYLLGLAVIVNSFIEAFSSVFRAYEEMFYVSFLMIFQKVSCTILAILVLVLDFQLIGVVNAYLITSILTFILSIIILIKKFVKLEFKIDIKSWKRMIKEAYPIGMAIFFSAIYVRIDNIMLFMIKGDAPVGWYNAAYKPMEALMVIPISFIGALFPIFSNFYVNSKSALVIVYKKAVKVLLVIILPIAVGTTILSEKFIMFVYGSQFTNSINALRMLVWVSVIMFVNYVLTQLLIAINRQRFSAIFALICAIFNIGLNLILIPRFSYMGAGFATIATEGLLFVLCFYAISRYLGTIPLFGITIKPLLASLLMGCILIVLRKYPLFITIPISAVIYSIAIFLLRTFNKSDYVMLKEAIKG